MPGAQLRNLGLEVLQGVEGGVDGGEAQVGHLIKLAKRPQDRQADLVGVDDRLAVAPHRFLDLVGQQGQIVVGDRSPLTGTTHSPDHFGAGEGIDST